MAGEVSGMTAVQPSPPSWFKGRQGTAEPAGENLYRLTAPNVSEAYIGIRLGSTGAWSGFFRRSADSPDEAVTAAEFENSQDAWQAAFELYRRHMIV